MNAAHYKVQEQCLGEQFLSMNIQTIRRDGKLFTASNRYFVTTSFGSPFKPAISTSSNGHALHQLQTKASCIHAYIRASTIAVELIEQTFDRNNSKYQAQHANARVVVCLSGHDDCHHHATLWFGAAHLKQTTNEPSPTCARLPSTHAKYIYICT